MSSQNERDITGVALIFLMLSGVIIFICLLSFLFSHFGVAGLILGVIGIPSATIFGWIRSNEYYEDHPDKAFMTITEVIWLMVFLVLGSYTYYAFYIYE